MIILFFSILIIAALFALVIYRFNGKTKLFSFDLVQFIYLFVIAPMIFIWLKTFFFFILREQVLTTLTLSQYFIIDTLLSVIALYLFGVLAIHTITKVFWLEKHRDPFADIFKLSEYFHLWWSHIIMYLGGFVLITTISVLNLFFRLPTSTLEPQRGLLILIGFIFGFIIYFTIWSSDPVQEKTHFLRLMKLSYVFFFLLYVFMYYLVNPPFHLEFGLYWFGFFTFLSTSTCVILFRRSEKALRFRNFLLHPGWGENIEIFNPIRKEGEYD